MVLSRAHGVLPVRSPFCQGTSSSSLVKLLNNLIIRFLKEKNETMVFKTCFENDSRKIFRERLTLIIVKLAFSQVENLDTF